MSQPETEIVPRLKKVPGTMEGTKMLVSSLTAYCMVRE